MSEEQVVAPATTEASSTETPPAPPVEEKPAAAPQVDWKTVLDTLDPNDLRKHPRIAGIVGSEVDQRLRRREAEMAAAAKLRAQEEQDAEFSRLLAENDPMLAEQYPKAREALIERQKQRDIEQFERRVGETKAEFAHRIGQAYFSLPEWGTLTDEDRAKLQAAIDAHPNDEDGQITAFVTTAADLVGHKKAEKLFAERLTQETKEREKAIRQELSAKMLNSTTAPDLKPPTGRSTKLAEIRQMSDAEFDRYWEEKYGRR